MTRARKELVSLDDTPFYHCTTRCVRRAFLRGTDASNGHCYEHRRGWIAHRIQQLASVFAFDIAAYAVMSNHYHVVFRVNRQAAEGWTRDQVIKRWRRLFSGPTMIQRYCAGATLSSVELDVVDEMVAEWRSRLIDISWFMRCLNKHIARRASAEDGCKGRFWESRFTTQALLDETAVLACMAYVDLNLIRAGMADRPETSDYTSIQDRLGLAPKSIEEGATKQDDTDQEPAPLLPFAGAIEQQTEGSHLPYHFADYLELVEWMGRAIRSNKRGPIPGHLPAYWRD